MEDVDSGVFALYDLKKDPLETKNIFKKKKDIAKDLQEKLENWKNETKLPAPTPNPEYVQKQHL